MFLYTKGILKLFYRFLNQRPIKTLRTIFSLRRLLATVWVESNKVKLNNFIKLIGENKDLLIESKNFEKKFIKEKKEKIKNLPISGGLKGSDGGGGGNEFILYYIVRHLKPAVVLESGVSAGASSRAILQALEENKKGVLFSSDLQVYLDKKDIGVLVTKELRQRWKLFDKGDATNLPIILNQINEIDIVYYDSEKSYSGKKIFFARILSNFTPKIIIIDDIDRDYWFRDFTKKNSYDYIVVGNVGMVFLK
tara:strand:+ start:303 stop:1055 length:753 start_codon:yes stop_codon:yes gene_type:complete